MKPITNLPLVRQKFSFLSLFLMSPVVTLLAKHQLQQLTWFLREPSWQHWLGLRSLKRLFLLVKLHKWTQNGRFKNFGDAQKHAVSGKFRQNWTNLNQSVLNTWDVIQQDSHNQTLVPKCRDLFSGWVHRAYNYDPRHLIRLSSFMGNSRGHN
jgi:hypothetical protein